MFYKLLIGGYFVLVFKDYVCELGFLVRKVFVRDCGYLFLLFFFEGFVGGS